MAKSVSVCWMELWSWSFGRLQEDPRVPRIWQRVRISWQGIKTPEHPCPVGLATHSWPMCQHHGIQHHLTTEAQGQAGFCLKFRTKSPKVIKRCLWDWSIELLARRPVLGEAEKALGPAGATCPSCPHLPPLLCLSSSSSSLCDTCFLPGSTGWGLNED